MKELSIEEKVKRYDEALHKAKNYYSTTDSSSDIKLIGLIFPELKESEDERIRKEMISWLKGFIGEEEGCGYTEDEIKERIAWLEKQGEHANFRNKIQIGDKVTRNEDGVLVNLSQLNRVAKKDEKQGEQTPKHFELKAGHWYICHRAFCCRADHLTVKEGERFMCEKDGVVKGFVIKEPEKYFKEVCAPAPMEDEQKPAWSEEDEEIHRKCICAMRASACGFPEEEKFVEQVDNWLESLKDRVLLQPKQEWSEEDENRINRLIAYFEDKESFTAEDDIVYANWLKSLRPQNHWKPSDEQMKAVKEAACYSSVFSEKTIDNLISLSKDLKKLKG